MKLAFWRPRHPVSDDDLSAMVDGALGDRAEAVQSHVDGCASCREVLAGLSAVHAAMMGLPRARAPRSFALREADVAAQPRPAPAAGVPGIQVLLGSAALVCAIAFLVLAGVDASGGSIAGRTNGNRSVQPAGVLSERASDASSTEPRNGGDAAVAGTVPDAPAPSSDGSEAYADATPPVSTPGCTTPDCADQDVNALGPAATAAPQAPSTDSASPANDELDETGLRIAEAVAAGAAVTAGLSLGFLLWRKRGG